jgi:DNA polymerase elongation subunit (family B)
MYTNAYVSGNNVYLRTPEGKEIIEFQPTLFMTGKNQSTKWKTLDDIPVHEIKPGTIKDCKEFIEQYKGISGVKLYGYTSWCDQFLSERYENSIVTSYDFEKVKIYALDAETSVVHGFPNWFNPVEEVVLITIVDMQSKQKHTWGCKSYTSDQNVIYHQCDNEEHLFREFLSFWKENIPDIITGWNTDFFDIPYIYHRMVAVLGEKTTSQLSPWGVVKVKIDNKQPDRCTVNIFGISQLDYLALYKKYSYGSEESYKLDAIAEKVLGHAKLNHDEFLTFNDFVTGEPKPDKNGNELQQLAYERNLHPDISEEWINLNSELKQKCWNKFTDYNIIDADLIIQLEEKLNMISLQVFIAYYARINYEDVFSPIHTWDAIIHNYLKEERSVVTPFQTYGGKTEQFDGAYVKQPKPGRYKWGVSFDLASLYPHLIQHYNVGVETLTSTKLDIDVDYLLAKKELPDNGLSIAANGWCYRKDVKCFFSVLMDNMYVDRSTKKKQQISLEKEYESATDEKMKKHLEKEISRLYIFQMALKILLNSAYGSLGSPYFRYFDVRMAESITSGGRLAIQWVANDVNAFLNKSLKTSNVDYVAYSDTDSIYIELIKLVEMAGYSDKSIQETTDFLNEFCTKVLQNVIKKSFDNMTDYMHAYENKMSMKLECIFDVGVWISKKRYAINVWESEGVRYEKPKLKVMGLDLVKSSTPKLIRSLLKESLPILFYKEESDIHSYVEGIKTQFMNMSIPEIANPSGVSDIDKFVTPSGYASGTPIHVRGSIMYNQMIKKHGLEKTHQLIKNGDKIKFTYLKTPNPLKENVIAFVDDIPKEFGLDRFVDYDLQFEKAFLSKMKNMIEPLGWNTEAKSNLDEFFG